MRSTPAPRARLKDWAGFAVLALPTILLGVDITALYLVVPTLAADLQPSSTQTLWIMDVYGFLIAGFLITMGTLGDRIGRRKLLLIGAVVFGAASVVAAYSTSAEMLIAARAALGIAGATLMPSALALIRNMFADARQRALAIGIWATMFAMGMALGPLIGGFLLMHFWWGSAFLVAIPVVVIVLLAAPLLLPEYRDPQAGRFDLPSVALSLAAILPVVYAVKQAAAYGVDLMTLGTLVAGVGFAVLFVRRQRKLDSPLLDLGLFRSRTFSAALSVLLLVMVGFGGMMFLVTQYLQLVEGLSPMAAGAWLAPPALMMFVAAITVPLVAQRVRPGYIAAATLALSTVGYALLGQVNDNHDVITVVTGFGLVYFGMGAVYALSTDLVVGAAPPTKAGSAASTSEMATELGFAVGVAVFGSLTAAIYRGQITNYVPNDLPDDVAVPVSDSLAATTSVSDQVPESVLLQATQAFTTGLNTAALVAGGSIAVLAIVSAVVLRHIGPIAGEEDQDVDLGAMIPDAADD